MALPWVSVPGAVRVADVALTLRRGEILAEGDYATVAADPRVRTAYMGTEA